MKYYNKSGKEISFQAWADLFEDLNYKVVKQQTVGKYYISTVWLGMDHGIFGDKPIIFETMVFNRSDSENDYLDREMQRYSTLEEAKEGHREMVKKYRN